MKNVILSLLMAALLGLFGCDLDTSDNGEGAGEYYDFQIYNISSAYESALTVQGFYENVIYTGYRGGDLVDLGYEFVDYETDFFLEEAITYSEVISLLYDSNLPQAIVDEAYNSIAAYWYYGIGGDICIIMVQDVASYSKSAEPGDLLKKSSAFQGEGAAKNFQKFSNE